MNRFFTKLWCLILLLTGVKYYWHIGAQKTPATSAYATMDLPPNHLLIAGDLKEPAPNFENHYLITPKKKGDHIQLPDLHSTPILPKHSEDSSIAILPLRDEELKVLEMIDAGALIYLIYSWVADSSDVNKNNMQTSELFPISIKVIAIHRHYERTDANWIWIQFPVAAYKSVSGFIAAKYRVITRA
jgi:hypothetical protein